MDVVRHRRCRRMGGLLSPRVHPSGITRGYAWCVPAGDSGDTRRKSAFFHLSSMLCAASSPAVTHGVSLPRKVGEHAMWLWGVDTIRAWADAIRM